MKDDIGDRFKGYEACFDFSLPRRLPMVIRVDGRAFHGLPLEKPFDACFVGVMQDVAIALCKEIQGSVLAYIQSDEISVIARDDMTNTTEPWMGKRLSKVVSLSAAIATSVFTASPIAWAAERQFDSRAFVLPDLNEVTNYLIWRQQDATRNSISMCAHAAFSHASLHGVDSNGKLDRLREAGKPWEDIPTHYKRGMVCKKVSMWCASLQAGDIHERHEWQIDLDPPVFTQDRSYIESAYGPPRNPLFKSAQTIFVDGTIYSKPTASNGTPTKK